MANNKEKWSGTYYVARADSTEITTYKVKGKYTSDTPMIDIVDSLQEKVTRRLYAKRIFDFDIVDSVEEMV